MISAAAGGGSAGGTPPTGVSTASPSRVIATIRHGPVGVETTVPMSFSLPMRTARAPPNAPRRMPIGIATAQSLPFGRPAPQIALACGPASLSSSATVSSDCVPSPTALVSPPDTPPATSPKRVVPAANPTPSAAAPPNLLATGPAAATTAAVSRVRQAARWMMRSPSFQEMSPRL